ncbi:hypothetical protein PVAND_005843 [Polypedilum vanderplanki]|uniref:DNA helicase n=1 Tax=Polypedilum vanderplanki TaxID=319348 RepID=A0A9J6C2F9_POLVA|nr:hypothetical protein PVAND_005843 [Polypedilum vanderplanki]
MADSIKTFKEDYLMKYHGNEIKELLTSSNSSKRNVVQISLSTLKSENKNQYSEFYNNYNQEHNKWKKALKNITDKLLNNEKLSQKEIEIRYFQSPDICWPRLEFGHLGKVCEFRAYVYQTSFVTKLEYIREIQCSKCKKKTTIEGDRAFKYNFALRKNCNLSYNCPGKLNFIDKESPEPEYTIDFQTIMVQEIDKFTPKDRMLTVQATNNLVNSCHIGDVVRVLGMLEIRFNDRFGSYRHSIVLHAINIAKENLELKLILEPDEMTKLINAWNDDKRRHQNCEIKARDEMLKAVAPGLTNCFGLKLALMITLCSGDGKRDNDSSSHNKLKDRESVHLLLAGIPGTGKSELVKAALKISARGIKTTGLGSSKVGLTASYRMGGKEEKDHIEAGALVVASNGICCIDEFNYMPTSVRHALHEAMEQQRFTLHKANMKIEVHTKCSIIATLNHKVKHFSKDVRSETDEELKMFNMEPSLASRFDLMFLLDHPGEDYDSKIIDFIMDNYEKIIKMDENARWNESRLQLHIICAKGIEIEVTEEVEKIANQYFQFCLACEGVNISRKTYRLLHSIKRLTISHAKMLLRKRTKIIDVMTAIWFMENSFSFGYLIQPESMLESPLPIGPTVKCIEDTLDNLNLTHLFGIFKQEEAAGLEESLKPVDSNEFYGRNKKNAKNKSILDVPDHLKKSFNITTIEDLFDNNAKTMVDEPKMDEFEDFDLDLSKNFNTFKQDVVQTSTQAKDSLIFKKPIQNSYVKSSSVEKELQGIYDVFEIQNHKAPNDECYLSFNKELDAFNQGIERTSTRVNGNSEFKKPISSVSAQKTPIEEHKNKKPKLLNDDDIEESLEMINAIMGTVDNEDVENKNKPNDIASKFAAAISNTSNKNSSESNSNKPKSVSEILSTKNWNSMTTEKSNESNCVEHKNSTSIADRLKRFEYDGIKEKKENNDTNMSNKDIEMKESEKNPVKSHADLIISDDFDDLDPETFDPFA